MDIKEKLKICGNYRTLWLSLLVPLLLLPIPLVYPSQVTKCAYCVLVIGTFWVTEVIPLAVTSLLPIFLFPLFGIMSAKETCTSYAKDTLMLFLGSLIVAVAVERWDLHRRLALRTLSLVGPQPQWLMFGIMLPCWFLSMWMSNTATAAMMMPIVNAILEQIKLSRKQEDPGVVAISMDTKGKTDDHDKEDGDIDKAERGSLLEEKSEQPEDEEYNRLAKSFSLCVAFSANVGGIATLTGTPPNIIFKGQADITFKDAGGSDINFASWMVVGFPISVVLFFLTWGWLYVYTVRAKVFKCSGEKESYEAVRNIISKETRKLGNMSFPEVVVLVNFITLALLWITRKPGFIPGWGNLLKDGYSGDSTPAILISVLLFILPAKMPVCFRKVKNGGGGPKKIEKYEPILTWKAVNEKMAWGVLLLMGGGFAVADACQRSGLSQWVSGHLMAMQDLEPWVIAFVLSIVISMATQVTSNSATATLFLPIAANLAINLGIHPIYFMIPCALAASLAFLLPVATPPNAIVFASGYLTVKDMVVAGSVINILSLVVVSIALNTWVVPFYNLGVLPDIFLQNSTTTTTTLAPLVSTVVPLNYTG